MSVCDTWEAVRALDEAENWAERTRVLSKTDHAELICYAMDIIHELVDNLPISSSNLPCQNEEVVEFTEDDFKCSTAQFDVDYLENLKTKSNLEGSTLTRESIYVKFDPLVTKPSPTAADKQVHLELEYGKRDLLLLDTPPHCLARVQPSHREDYHEVSGFSPVSHASDHIHTRVSAPALIDGSSKDTPVPVTSCLVKVLKYSDEDLRKLVELAKRRAYQREREKMEAELQHLRDSIKSARCEVKSHHDRVYILDSKRLSHLTHLSKLEDERKRLRKRAVGKYQMIEERLTCYEELRKQKYGVESYQTVLAKDRVQLENAFDELHSHYVKQKDTNKQLLRRFKEAETYLTELREWHQQSSMQHDGLMNAKEALKEEIKQKSEAVHKEHEAKLAVERTKTKKQGLRMGNLKEDLYLVEQEKQQLSQICDDLMRQLELNTGGV